MIEFLLGLWLGGAIVGSVIMYKMTREIPSTLVMIVWPFIPLIVYFGRSKD